MWLHCTVQKTWDGELGLAPGMMAWMLSLMMAGYQVTSKANTQYEMTQWGARTVHGWCKSWCHALAVSCSCPQMDFIDLCKFVQECGKKNSHADKKIGPAVITE